MSDIQLLLIMGAFYVSTWFIEGIVERFILAQNGKLHTNNAVRIWRGGFLIFALLIFSQQIALTFPLGMSLFLLLCWGYVFTLFDSSNHWLPRQYTLGFWLNGLLLTQLDGDLTQLLNPLIISIVTCLILLSIRAISSHFAKKQTLGLGDVLLVAGYLSWFNWQGAAQIAGISFLVLAMGGVCARRPHLPYAPFLFITTLLVMSVLPNDVHSLLKE